MGADAHVKYQSKKSFGAVLIARNPVKVTAYNDEYLFKEWIAENKAQLYSKFGHQLKKYGLWIVTVTYTAPGCSINAWMDKDKDALLSAKAKAAMVGDLGAELDWTDKITDKDWCHYTAKPYRDAIDVAPAVVPSTAEAIRLSGRRPLANSRIPLQVASAVDHQLMKGIAPRRHARDASAARPDARPERILSRKSAINPVGNIRISALHSKTNYDPDLRSPNVHRTELSPVASITDETDRPVSGGAAPIKPTDPKSPPDRAASEGVVMFYDGLYADTFDWWLEGIRNAYDAFGSRRRGREKEAGKIKQHTPLRNSSARYQQSARPQRCFNNDETYEIRHDVVPHHPYGLYDDSDIGYHPEKDEGVHPRYWPAKDPSLRATSNALNRRSFVSQSFKGSNTSPSRMSRLDEKT